LLSGTQAVAQLLDELGAIDRQRFRFGWGHSNWLEIGGK
jgi:hypothetical protein